MTREIYWNVGHGDNSMCHYGLGLLAAACRVATGQVA
jgi:hypothetical protein